MNSDLVRFSVTMPKDLLESFERIVERRGIKTNRSEAIRDLVRDAMVKEEWSEPGQETVGTITLVYNHHASDVSGDLDEVEHHHLDQIISTMHVHLDEDNCLEVIALRGKSEDIREISDLILGMKGVKHGSLSMTTTGQHI